MLRPLRPIKRWWQSRDFGKLLLALPALIACLTWGAYAALVVRRHRVDTESDYRDMASAAMSARDFETARLAFDRLSRISQEKRGEYLFNMALCIGNLGREEEATALLSYLAPQDRAGYAPAHLFLAKSLLRETNATPATVRTVELHLRHIIESGADPVEPQFLLGQIYMRQGRLDEARKLLLDVVATRNEAALPLAVVLRAQGDLLGASKWAGLAAAYFADRVGDAKADDQSLRLQWADALILIQNYEKAFSVLETGWKQFGNPAYPPAIGNVCANWVRATASQAPDDLARRIKLIQQGLQYAPQNEGLLQEMIALTRLQGPAADTARDTMNKLLAQGNSSAFIHFCLGADAWQHHEEDKARQHFTIAFEQAPHLPYIANNMAVLLTLSDNPDCKRALEIIQPIVEKFPNDPNFRESRGQVLVKLGRYEEGIKDLEFALPHLKSANATHRALAEGYRHLGMPDLATEHEKLSK
jgi:tetratricopeptide (TPR) repeat protein